MSLLLVLFVGTLLHARARWLVMTQEWPKLLVYNVPVYVYSVLNQEGRSETTIVRRRYLDYLAFAKTEQALREAPSHLTKPPFCF